MSTWPFFIQDFGPVIYHCSQLSVAAMPFPKCVLPVLQEFMFIKMGHNIRAYNMFKKRTRNACQRNRTVIAGK